MSRNKTPPIAAVDLCNDRRDLGEGGRCGWVEAFLADALHVGGDAVAAVGVDAAEVGLDETFCDNEGVGWWGVVCD